MNATTERQPMQIKMLDPHDLAPHPRNVRTALGDLEGLTESIREQGVLEPLTVVPINGSGFQLLAGHRRAAAAIAAGLDVVPCVVRRDLATDDADSPLIAEHIGAMLAENLQREGLTTMEEARGVAQMLDLGMPLTRIAKRTGLGQKRVKKAAGVARLDADSAAEVEAQQLDLDSAAVIAQFADEPEARGRLLLAAERGPGQLAHAVEQIKRDQKVEKQLQARAAELRAEGRTVVEDFAPAGANLRRLDDADGNWLTDREAEHRSCPGSAVHLIRQWNGIEEQEVCTDWKANGHVDRWASSALSTPKPETPEELEAAREERRLVIENNKLMAAANAVRRAWVRELLARRSAPPEVLRFAVEELGRRPQVFSWWLMGNSAPGDKGAAEELGLAQPVRPWSQGAESKRDTLTTGEQVPDGRLPLQLLAHVAGAIELGIGKDAWRVTEDRRDGLVRWLTFLAGLGYTLADVEQQLVDGVAA